MKIISKYKDYYDYFQGIYGIDTTKIYDRRDAIIPHIPTTGIEILYVFIANKSYKLFFYNEKLYYTPEEILEMNILYNKTLGEQTLYKRYYRESEDINYIKKNWKPYSESIRNKEHRKPVLALWDHRRDDYFVPILSDVFFYKILDASKLYIEIEGFLGWLVDNPPLPDTQTNEGKIISHGFDLKQSFRHRKV